MAKTKTSAAVKNRYAAKTYDRLSLLVPKGQKSTIKAFADQQGESVNGIMEKALLAYMGLKDWPEETNINDREEGAN